jgi:hypothetical protein
VRDLEQELERELHRVLDPVAASPIPPRRPVHRQVGLRALTGGTGVALTVKVLSGAVVTAAAVTVAGVATTGTVNPVDWGHEISNQVMSAPQHGAAGPTPASQHGSGSTGSSGTANGNAAGQSKDKGKNQNPPPKADSGSQPTLDPEPSDPVGTYPPVTISPRP